MKLWLAIGAMGIGACAAAGCALGLDPSLISGADGGAQSGASSAAKGADGAPAATGDPCNVDADCAAVEAAGSCITSASCDPVWHVCMLDVCDVGACRVASCDLLAKQCSAAAAYGFAVSVFHIASGVGGWGPRYAVAAAYPFLFVLTTNGVVAYDVANPTGTVPPSVMVHGAPFIPAALVASGRRVYLVGAVEGGGPTFRQAIAWIDVPGDPFLASLTATTAWIGTTEPTLANALWNGTTGVALTYAATADPTSSLPPAPDDSTTLVPSPIASLATGASIVGASGGELVAYRYASSGLPFFSLVSNVDQGGGRAGAEQVIAAYGVVDDQAAFATGPDSTVLWTSAPLALDSDGNATGLASARVTWLSRVADGGTDAGPFSIAVHADLELYPASTTGPVVGPLAYVDSDTAIALAASAQDPQSTSIQVFSRSANAVASGQRAVIPASPSTLGVAASRGFGYVLVQDDTTNESATVYVVAPGCPGGPVADGGGAPEAGPTVEGGVASEGGVSAEGGGKGSQSAFHQLN